MGGVVDSDLRAGCCGVLDAADAVSAAATAAADSSPVPMVCVHEITSLYRFMCGERNGGRGGGVEVGAVRLLMVWGLDSRRSG